MSTSSVNPQLEAAAKRFVSMCMDQHDQTPSELLVTATQEWKRLRRDSGLEKALKLDTPRHEYITRKDGTVEFLRK